MTRTLYELQKGQEKAREDRVNRHVVTALLFFVWSVLLVILAIPTVLAVWLGKPLIMLAYFGYAAVIALLVSRASKEGKKTDEDS